MHNVKIDMTGKRFGKLVVLQEDSTSKKNNLRWICRCDCGRLCSKRGADLRKGKIKHCGCESPYEGVRNRKPLMKEETVRKYGCAWCADRPECEKHLRETNELNCKYADIFEQYDSYKQYDQEATENFFDIVSGFPENIK